MDYQAGRYGVRHTAHDGSFSDVCVPDRPMGLDHHPMQDLKEGMSVCPQLFALRLTLEEGKARGRAYCVDDDMKKPRTEEGGAVLARQLAGSSGHLREDVVVFGTGGVDNNGGERGRGRVVPHTFVKAEKAQTCSQACSAYGTGYACTAHDEGVLAANNCLVLSALFDCYECVPQGGSSALPGFVEAVAMAKVFDAVKSPKTCLTHEFPDSINPFLQGFACSASVAGLERACPCVGSS